MKAGEAPCPDWPAYTSQARRLQQRAHAGMGGAPTPGPIWSRTARAEQVPGEAPPQGYESFQRRGPGSVGGGGDRDWGT